MGNMTTTQLADIDPIDDLDIKVSTEDFVKMSLCALGLTVIAVALPSLSVMRLNPKNIMSKHS